MGARRNYTLFGFPFTKSGKQWHNANIITRESIWSRNDHKQTNHAHEYHSKSWLYDICDACLLTLDQCNKNTDQKWPYHDDWRIRYCNKSETIAVSSISIGGIQQINIGVKCLYQTLQQSFKGQVCQNDL